MSGLTALKTLREEQALSQRDLAKLSGVAQDSIGQIERGERKARPSTIRKLAEALGVEPSKLLSGHTGVSKERRLTKAEMRDRLEDEIAWLRYVLGHEAAGFGTGVKEDDYEEYGVGKPRHYTSFGNSLGDLFESKGSDYLHTIVNEVNITSWNDAAEVGVCFRCQEPVFVNLQQADDELSRRVVDFCAGLTFAVDGRIQVVANRIFLLTPHDVEVSLEECKRFVADEASHLDYRRLGDQEDLSTERRR